MTEALRQELAQRIRDRKVLVVTGTGVSLAATGGHPHASWKGLIANGIDRCVELPSMVRTLTGVPCTSGSSTGQA